jgi:PAS domain S-box-containing protein
MGTNKIKALIIEDSDDDLKLMLRELKKGQYEIEYKVVEDIQALSNALETEWDVIISDYSLPTFTGYDALMMCKEKGVDIPFIMVSGTIGEELAVSMMKAYAKDYIMKNNLVRLLPAIEREIADAKIRKEKIIADEEIKNSHKLLQRIIDLLPIRIFWKDINLKYLGCNTVFAKDAGKDSSSDLIGKDDFQINWKEQAGIYQADDKIVMTSGKSKLNLEEPQTTPTGGTIWLRTNKTPLTDLNGNTIGLLGSYEDITEQKHLINELIESKEKAEEINRLKSSFLANMSHELRTPMVGILGFSELMNETDNIAEIKDMAKIIHRGALRLFNTLDQILNLSSLESNKLKSNYKLTDIISIVRESIDLYRKEASKKKINLKFDSEIDSLIINTDQKMIYSSLNNVIQNAIYYTKEGSIDIKIREKIIDDKDCVVINIIDTGIGIAEENIEIIFNEFRQVSEGWGRSFEGTGLGLSLCRKYMNLIGGSVCVKSKPGVGSDFELIIPKNTTCIIENSVLPEKNTGMADKDYLKTQMPGNKPKILYIENEKDCTELVTILLHKRYVVESASTGKEGIEKAAKTEYSLILLDINLGKEMNGLEAMKEIKKNHYYKNIPFIAVTGFAMKGDENEFINAGCYDYLSKPFNKTILFEKISNALNQKVHAAAGI